MQKRLVRTPDKAMIGGVCAGIAEYFDVDPTWIRLLAVLLIFASGFGLVAYIVAWIVIPRGPLAHPAEATPLPANAAPARLPERRGAGFLPGVILILVGMAFLFDNLFFWFDWDYVWPLFLVGAGVVFIYFAVKPDARREEHTATDIAEVHNGSR
jgi:phage shock protein PspC (stress-responsive transcriptional regulator)